MDWNELKPRILKLVKPTEDERLKVNEFSEKLIRDVNRVLEAEGFEARAELHGSVTHGTWVRGSEDLDLFIVLDPKYRREDLHKVLGVLKMTSTATTWRPTPSIPTYRWLWAGSASTWCRASGWRRGEP